MALLYKIQSFYRILACRRQTGNDFGLNAHNVLFHLAGNCRDWAIPGQPSLMVLLWARLSDQESLPE
jgi:hypothetical protein